MQDNFIVQQSKIDIGQMTTVSYINKIHFHENWCDSYNDKQNINFIFNAPICIGNNLYNTLNVQNYIFDIFDVFNFFVPQKICYKDNTIIYQCVNESNKYNNAIEEKIQLNNKQYILYSNIDGLIFHNNIKLTYGQHCFRIKKLNSPKAFDFKVKIIAPYVKQNNKIYKIQLNDLDNAKKFPNYFIEKEQFNLDKKITFI